VETGEEEDRNNRTHQKEMQKSITASDTASDSKKSTSETASETTSEAMHRCKPCKHKIALRSSTYLVVQTSSRLFLFMKMNVVSSTWNTGGASLFSQNFTFLKNRSCKLGMASPLKSLLMIVSPRGVRMKNWPSIA
jgi:hypothetical protein